jgi:hypothetical protein
VLKITDVNGAPANAREPSGKPEASIVPVANAVPLAFIPRSRIIPISGLPDGTLKTVISAKAERTGKSGDFLN